MNHFCPPQHEGSYRKSTIDLNDCLKNDNGNFTSNLGKSSAFGFPNDLDSNIHLEGGKVVAELPKTKWHTRNHATYDLDICLFNENGELKWKIRDGLLDRDGGITKAVEAIPGLGLIMALTHKRNNDLDHAKRALTLSGKGLFAILFGIYAIEFGRFDPSMAPIVALMSFLGTVIADLTIETMGRAWIKSERIKADIPDRDLKDTLLDGLVAGVAVGAATGIGPQAEEAAAWALRAVATVPEEIAIAELEALSLQNVLYNAPKLAREIVKAATGGVVRASPSGFQMLTGHSSVTPGRYYIANSQAEHLLQPGPAGDDGKTRIQGSKAHFKDHQVWVIENGKIGFTIKSSHSNEYIGHHNTGTEAPTLSLVGHEDAIEFLTEGNRKDGLFFLVAEGLSNGLVLELERNDSPTNDFPIKLGANVASLQQKWFIEDCYPDTLELYHGPVSTDTTLSICDIATGLPLRINPPRAKSALGWRSSADEPRSQTQWILEAGFNGYYLRHLPSGLFVLAGPRAEVVNTIPLTLGRAETEFALEGNDQDGYSIVYASNPSYGLELDNDVPGASARTLLLWKPDASHPKWRIETLT
ncbi:hypothetical protein FRC07_006320 [Ceratobasidium sp. 392]|nr:hypothetical protein FRC07_006320 [Ceratobasidium sp. 392]